MHRAKPTVWEKPDEDINYGWGEDIQLKFDTPYVLAENRGEAITGGLGSSILGFKWRFFERKDSGLAVSMYPQWTTHMVRSSVERGVADPGSEWFLPFEVAIKVKEYDLDVEVGRRLSGDGQRGWDAGFIVGHDCRSNLECLLELRKNKNNQENITLVNIGSRWKLAEPFSVLTALGHEFGPAAAEPQDVQIYLGIQVRVE